MTQIQTLSELQPGQSATVRSPMGDPSAYLIRGTVIALRRCDCCGIRVAVP